MKSGQPVGHTSRRARVPRRQEMVGWRQGHGLALPLGSSLPGRAGVGFFY